MDIQKQEIEECIAGWARAFWDRPLTDPRPKRVGSSNGSAGNDSLRLSTDARDFEIVERAIAKLLKLTNGRSRKTVDELLLHVHFYASDVSTFRLFGKPGNQGLTRFPNELVGLGLSEDYLKATVLRLCEGLVKRELERWKMENQEIVQMDEVRAKKKTGS